MHADIIYEIVGPTKKHLPGYIIVVLQLYNHLSYKIGNKRHYQSV